MDHVYHQNYPRACFQKNETVKNAIAFFDFDGTITCKDTLFEIVRFQKGNFNLYLGLIRLSPWLVAMKLGLITNAAAKEKMLTHFFNDTRLEDFQKKCDQFIEKALRRLIRRNALEEIKRHLQNDVTVVVVTASAENWVEGWCKKMNLHCIATRLEVKDDKITGKINGKNCNGIEKVNRIKADFDLSRFDTIFAYGDTKGDKEMLSLATFPFYKPFH